jgi:hypothetical protein
MAMIREQLVIDVTSEKLTCALPNIAYILLFHARQSLPAGPPPIADRQKKKKNSFREIFSRKGLAILM